MTFTYNSTNPLGTSKDWVRWRVGDTSSLDVLQSDQEITGAISSFGSKQAAAAATCDAIAAKFARRMDTAHGKVKQMWSQLADRYMKLAETLRDEEAKGLAGVGPWAGAVSVAAKNTQLEDTDRTLPSFAREQFDITEIDAGTSVQLRSTV